eukprot:g2096.t1
MSIRNHRVAHDGDANHEQGRRKSSVVQSFRDLFIGNQSQGNDRSGPKPENSKLMDKIEQKLQRFRNEFKQLQKQEALNLAEIYFNEEDFQGDEIRRKEMVEICKVFARDVVREHFEQVEKAKQAIMRQRCTITAAIEVLDEGTDLALTIQYFSGAVSTIWAGWVMLAFMVANRGVQFIWTIIHHESWKRSAEAILGVRAITDTYHMITAGPDAKVGGSKAPMKTVQALRIGISLALESLPQVRGEIVDMSIFLSQIASVMASCGAMGLSAATSAFDMAHDQKWHISSLNGDLDAHRAALINKYLRDHLPWERIKTWLTEKTEAFQNHPPLWLSHKWLNLIPTEIRNDIWNVEQYNILKDAITQADENDNTGERERAANELF